MFPQWWSADYGRKRWKVAVISADISNNRLDFFFFKCPKQILRTCRRVFPQIFFSPHGVGSSRHSNPHPLEALDSNFIFPNVFSSSGNAPARAYGGNNIPFLQFSGFFTLPTPPNQLAWASFVKRIPHLERKSTSLDITPRWREQAPFVR